VIVDVLEDLVGEYEIERARREGESIRRGDQPKELRFALKNDVATVRIISCGPIFADHRTVSAAEVEHLRAGWEWMTQGLKDARVEPCVRSRIGTNGCHGRDPYDGL